VALLTLKASEPNESYSHCGGKLPNSACNW